MRVLRLAFGNWASRVYLAGVAAVAGWVFWTMANWAGLDANLAPVWLILVTLPLSLPGAWLSADTTLGPTPLWAGIVLGALANAAALGWLVSMMRRRTRPRA